MGLVEVDRGTERGGPALGGEAGRLRGAVRGDGAAGGHWLRQRAGAGGCPDARRRDGLAASLPEWSQQTGLPTELLERIWLVERGALAGTNLGEATWRRTGSGAQWPLVRRRNCRPSKRHERDHGSGYVTFRVVTPI